MGHGLRDGVRAWNSQPVILCFRSLPSKPLHTQSRTPLAHAVAESRLSFSFCKATVRGKLGQSYVCAECNYPSPDKSAVCRSTYSQLAHLPRCWREVAMTVAMLPATSCHWEKRKLGFGFRLSAFKQPCCPEYPGTSYMNTRGRCGTGSFPKGSSHQEFPQA